MSRIRSKNTSPEVTVRRLLHRFGYRFRLHRADLPGKPDLVFPGRRKVVFVHGCFWHQHAGCRRSHVPQSREGYWLPKLKRNAARDEAARVQLSAAKWQVLVIWECEVRDESELAAHLMSFLGPPGAQDSRVGGLPSLGVSL